MFCRMQSGPGSQRAATPSCAELWSSPAPLIWQVSVCLPRLSSRQMKLSLMQKANIPLSHPLCQMWQTRASVSTKDFQSLSGSGMRESLWALSTFCLRSGLGSRIAWIGFSTGARVKAKTLYLGANATFTMAVCGKLKVVNTSLPTCRGEKHLDTCRGVVSHVESKVLNDLLNFFLFQI